jgi:hypothetical protein
MEQKGYKNHFCSNRCSCAFNKNVNENILPKKRQDEYYKSPKKCLYCNSIIPFEKRHDNANYCSSKCSATHTQKDGGHCRWNKSNKQRLRELSKKNPYFNGTITAHYIHSPVVKEERICPTCNKNFNVFPSSPKKCCSRKCYGEWAVKTGYMTGKTGGYRAKGGRGKQGWYKGFYCNSSWELAWVIYQLEHGVNFKRNTSGFQYEFVGKKLKFYPDFILDNGEYVEVKGYTDDKVRAKFAYFPYKLQVIGKNEIKPFIQYVVEKYGKDYINLYETKEKSFSI